MDLHPVAKGGVEPDVFVRKDIRNKGLSVQVTEEPCINNSVTVLPNPQYLGIGS